MLYANICEPKFLSVFDTQRNAKFYNAVFLPWYADLKRLRHSKPLNALFINFFGFSNYLAS